MGISEGWLHCEKHGLWFFGTRRVPKPPFGWISLLYLVLADRFPGTSGVHGRGWNPLRLQGRSR